MTYATPRTASNRTGRPTFHIVLRPEPEVRDAIRALRWLLKACLRIHRFRCLSIIEERQP